MIIDRLWKAQPGKYFCLSTKSRSGEWKDHFFTRSQFNTIKSFIDDNQDKDLYFCPHGFRKARRLKEYAEIPKLLWADLDETDPRELDLMPTVAFESSPGRFVGLWVIDKFMTEDLNRRLTYYIEADPGGWDLTQVLRVPGTKNFKYDSTPRVRILWTDGDSYTVKQIEAKLPKEKKKANGATASTAAQIYKKYEKNLSGFVRREILRGKPKKGKRSEVIWRLVNELIEAGMNEEEAFEVLRASPWNKFKKRRDGDRQLKREIGKAIGHHLRVEDDEGGPDYTPDDDDEEEEDDEPQYNFLGRTMEDVEERDIDWVWYPYLARGELTILEGDPGLGKSYFAQIISLHIADGKRLPSDKAKDKTKVKRLQGKIAYFDMENSSDTVTKKRLVTNGLENFKNFIQEEEPFTVEDEDALDAVYQALEREKPALVVFDTINTYIGAADTHKSSETQRAFKSFVEIARRFNCAVMVLRHLTKSSKERALYRGQGSIAFAGLARIILTVGQSPDDDDYRIVATTKNNVTRIPRSLSFTIEALPDTLKHTDRSIFRWGEFTDHSADEIVTVTKHREDVDNSSQYEDFLKSILDDGEMNETQLKRAAESRSLSMLKVRKTADAMNVKRRPRKKGGDREIWWSLD